MYASSCQLLTSIVYICFSSGEDFPTWIWWNMSWMDCIVDRATSQFKNLFYLHDIRFWFMLANNNVIISGNFAIFNGCSLIWHPRAIAYDSCLHRYISCPLFANALFLWWTWLAYICKRPASWGWCSILQDWIKSGQYNEIIEILRVGCKKKKKHVTVWADPPLPHPSKLTSFFGGRKMFHFLKFFPLYLSLMIMISLMILICFVNHLAFFVPPHITCLETRILTVVAFEGIFPLWWTWLAYICRGTSFSRFGAFAADSDYPYYPHHPEPHFLLSPNSFLATPVALHLTPVSK